MYTKDKHHRITLRLNDEQMEYVRSTAEVLGVSPSDFLRMVVNTSMFGAKKGMYTLRKDGVRRENEETDIDNQL